MKSIKLFILFFISIFMFSQKTSVDWLTVEEAEKLQKGGDKRPFFFDVYTDWCGYCKVMDAKTYSNKNVYEYINKNYIPVKFDAEMKESVTFKGQQFDWVSGGKNGVNTFAYALLKGQMNFPSVAILSDVNQTHRVIAGYFQPDDFIKAIEDK